MWETEINTKINGSITSAWKALITPALWAKIDPAHYEKVEYPKTTLVVGIKGRMKAESQTFSFKPVKIDSRNYKVVTESPLPFGKLRITKQLVANRKTIELKEKVIATGPFAKVFSKLFFNKKVKATLPAQHEAIKKYVENNGK